MICDQCGGTLSCFRSGGFDVLSCRGRGSGEATGFVEGYGIIDLVHNAATGTQTVSARDGHRQTRVIGAPR